MRTVQQRSRHLLAEHTGVVVVSRQNVKIGKHHILVD